MLTWTLVWTVLGFGPVEIGTAEFGSQGACAAAQAAILDTFKGYAVPSSLAPKYKITAVCVQDEWTVVD